MTSAVNIAPTATESFFFLGKMQDIEKAYNPFESNLVEKCRRICKVFSNTNITSSMTTSPYPLLLSGFFSGVFLIDSLGDLCSSGPSKKKACLKLTVSLALPLLTGHIFQTNKQQQAITSLTMLSTGLMMICWKFRSIQRQNELGQIQLPLQQLDDQRTPQIGYLIV